VKTEPFIPVPYRKGNKFLRKYEVPFVDRVGNKATLVLIDYIDKKGKLIEGYTMCVKWKNNNER